MEFTYQLLTKLVRLRIAIEHLRASTGTMRSKLITDMEKLTAIQPLSQRRETKNMIQAEKFKCLPDHPMKEKLNRLTKNRLKRSSFVHVNKKLIHKFHELLKDTLPICQSDILELWSSDQPDIKVFTISQCQKTYKTTK